MTSRGQVNTAWWEVAPTLPPQPLRLPTLNAGDKIYAFVGSNADYKGYDYFYVQNQSNGSYAPHWEYNPSYFSDSASGECIGERPSHGHDSHNNPLYYDLANFGSVKVHCLVSQGKGKPNWKGIGNWPHARTVMWNNNKHNPIALASVGPISNSADYAASDFSINWQASSPAY